MQSPPFWKSYFGVLKGIQNQKFEPLSMKNGDEVAIFWDYGEL